MSIKIVTYEITDKCNARCPQCMRTNPNGCIPNWSVFNKDINVCDFKKLAPKEFLKSLDVIDFNCPKGDPASHSNIFSILDYILDIKSNVKILFPTNGSLRNFNYWKKLASYKQVKVIFAIDGIDQETHEFYRRNTNLKKIFQNASAFINAGGEADWQFIIFDHNKHQVEKAQKISEEMNFKRFKPIISNRFNNRDTFTYEYKNKAYTLKPVDTEIKNLDNIKSIDCRYLKNQQLFIDINGYIMSCCYHAGSLFSHQYNPNRTSFNNFIDVSFENYNLDEFNIFKVGFDTAFNSYKKYMEDLEVQWQQLNPSMCKVVCGKC